MQGGVSYKVVRFEEVLRHNNATENTLIIPKGKLITGILRPPMHPSTYPKRVMSVPQATLSTLASVVNMFVLSSGAAQWYDSDLMVVLAVYRPV